MPDWQWNLYDAKAAWQDDAREQGWAEGETHRSEEIDLNLIRMGMLAQNICVATGLPPQRVLALAQLSNSKK